MDLQLDGTRVLVTGGSRGIGRATAASLVREGARVAICARGEADLADTARALGVHPIRTDLSTEAGARAAVQEAAEALGGLDGLVNNAGGSLGSGAFDQADGDAWTRVLDLNLLGAVHASRAAIERGVTSIVHVSSICGREYCTSAPYSAAKAALHGLTKEMARDLAPRGVRVNAVAPGSILFPGGSWDRRHRDKPELIEHMLKHELPFGRFGRPEEVADAIVFLLSPRAGWVSGSILVVDGAQGRAI